MITLRLYRQLAGRLGTWGSTSFLQSISILLHLCFFDCSAVSMLAYPIPVGDQLYVPLCPIHIPVSFTPCRHCPSTDTSGSHPNSIHVLCPCDLFSIVFSDFVVLSSWYHKSYPSWTCSENPNLRFCSLPQGSNIECSQQHDSSPFWPTYYVLSASCSWT